MYRAALIRSRSTSALNQIMLITCICKISVFKKGSIVFNLLGDHPSFAVRKCIEFKFDWKSFT